VQGFFIDEKYIVTSVHVFTQCIKYDNYYREKNKGVKGVCSAFTIASNGDQKSNSYNIERDWLQYEQLYRIKTFLCLK
jgi:hypothetical protein